MRAAVDLGAAVWRKSTYSGSGAGGGGNSCLEVADNISGVVPVRDSKSPLRPALAFPPEPWAVFVRAVSASSLEL
ncbi:DUF397 domain-containing protein [Streptomyces sp. NPDC052396]|uniref:DUF397 domain-containing protein n=1 Tax=Streptomyces sp. NPDC052396 TaxID=3365689 RepID=UPI0037CF3A0C